MKPRMFIASSSEHVNLAYAIQENLERSVECTVWSQGVFQISRSTMAALVDVVEGSDFGAFVLAPSDITEMRNRTNRVVRDNVIFELGLFAGRLGIERCFLVVPRGMEDFHLPTDLLGLTPADFDAERQDGNLVAALGPACGRISRAIAKLGRFAPPVPPQLNPTDQLLSDRGDCIAAITGWMGQRPTSENTAAIRYSAVDHELGLAPGSAKNYIEEAAATWRYVVAQKGPQMILFKDHPDKYVVRREFF